MNDLKQKTANQRTTLESLIKDRSKIKTCPLCGGEPILMISPLRGSMFFDYDELTQFSYIICSNKYCRLYVAPHTPNTLDSDTGLIEMEKTIKEWNELGRSQTKNESYSEK